VGGYGLDIRIEEKWGINIPFVFVESGEILHQLSDY
jgi:hypothetical protein